jgi:hypothetical protein
MRLKKNDLKKNEKKSSGVLEGEVVEKREGRITLLSKISKEGGRFAVYLPRSLNPTWEGLWKSKKQVKVVVEIV